MFVANSWIRAVEWNGKRVSNIGLQPIPKVHELFAGQVVRIDEGGITPGGSLVVFGDVAVIDFYAVQTVLRRRTGIGPNSR
jgi:hypothetical protein